MVAKKTKKKKGEKQKMALLKTKLQNMLREEAKKHNVELEFHLKNIDINGVKKGCSGHVVNTVTGNCVYLTTEEACLETLKGRAMYRLAKNIKDYSSNGLKNGGNRWVRTEELAVAVVHLLVTERGELR